MVKRKSRKVKQDSDKNQKKITNLFKPNMNEKNCKEKVILDDNGDTMSTQSSRDARSSELSACSEVADLAFD